jgi:hypothetical protein
VSHDYSEVGIAFIMVGFLVSKRIKIKKYFSEPGQVSAYSLVLLLAIRIILKNYFSC